MIKLLAGAMVLTFMSKPVSAQDQSMFEAFWDYCVAQTIQGTYVQREGLYEFTDSEIASFTENFRSTPPPEAIWTAADGAWIVIDADLDEPIKCTVVSFNNPADQNVVEWNAQMAGDVRFRSHGSAETQETQARGWATALVEGEFVQISLNNAVYSTDPFKSVSALIAVRVGQTPASCGLFPNEC